MPLYYRDAAAIIIVYDITSMNSYHNAQNWTREVQEVINKQNSIILFVGNKLDKQCDRKVSFEEVNTFANVNNFIYKEVSAKTGEGIEELFHTIGEKIPNSLQIPKKSNVILEKKRNSYWCFL